MFRFTFLTFLLLLKTEYSSVQGNEDVSCRHSFVCQNDNASANHWDAHDTTTGANFILFSHDLNFNNQTMVFYYQKHYIRRPPMRQIHVTKRSHQLILLLIIGIEPNLDPGPRPPRCPCGVCERAGRDAGQRALACDEAPHFIGLTRSFPTEKSGSSWKV